MRSSVRFQLCSCAASGATETIRAPRSAPRITNSNVAHSGRFYACDSARDQRSRFVRPALRPSAFCIKRRLTGRVASTARSPNDAQRCDAQAGSPNKRLQPVERGQHREIVAFALTLVPAQHLEIADVLAGEQRVLDDGRDGGCIKKSQVHALTRERVHRVRSVAEQARPAARCSAARAVLAAGSRRASSTP